MSNASEQIKSYLLKGFSLLHKEIDHLLTHRQIFSKVRRMRFSFKNNNLEYIPSLSEYVNPLYLSIGIYIILLMVLFPLMDPRKPVQFLGIIGMQMMITAWLVGWIYANEDKLGLLAVELLKNTAGNADSIARAIKKTIGETVHAEL
jgi:hypothetical protein